MPSTSVLAQGLSRVLHVESINPGGLWLIISPRDLRLTGARYLRSKRHTNDADGYLLVNLVSSWSQIVLACQKMSLDGLLLI